MSSAGRWSEISDILARALDLPESQREAFIASACERKPALRTEVLAMFQDLGTPNEFLETAPGVDAAAPVEGMGEAYWRVGQPADAIGAYQQSLEIRERISAADPKNAYARGRVAFMHHMLAKLYLSTGEFRAADRHAANALAIDEALTRTDRIYRAELAATLHTLAEIERRKGRRQAGCAADARAKMLFALVEEHDFSSDERASRAEVERALAACPAR